MNKFTTLAVVIVAACTVTYTIVTMIRNHRRYVRQKEALDRWFSAFVEHITPDTSAEIKAWKRLAKQKG